VASLSKKINKQLFLVFKKLMREFEAKSIQKILKDVIEAYTKNKADDISLNLTELEPYYADLYQAVEIIALKPLTVYGENCNKSWKQRKCHEVVTKRLGKGNLDHDFALSIYYWFHVFEGEIWGKRIDENIVRTTHDKPERYSSGERWPRSVKQIKEGTTLHDGSSCSLEIAPLFRLFEITGIVSDVEHNQKKIMRAKTALGALPFPLGSRSLISTVVTTNFRAIR
jgi:hypothetical protein